MTTRGKKATGTMTVNAVITRNLRWLVRTNHARGADLWGRCEEEDLALFIAYLAGLWNGGDVGWFTSHLAAHAEYATAMEALVMEGATPEDVYALTCALVADPQRTATTISVDEVHQAYRQLLIDEAETRDGDGDEDA